MFQDRFATCRASRRALLAAAPALALLAAPASRARQATPAAGGAWSFTDDRGSTVTLPQPPERIVAQISAAAALWDNGVRSVAVFGPQRLPDGSPGPEAGRVDLDAVTSLGEVWDEFDVEAMAALEPDLLVAPIFVGDELWAVPAESVDIIEAIVPSIGIRSQQIPMDDLIVRFEELAAALGADLASEENAAARAEFDAAAADVRDAIAGNPGLRVMFASSTPELFYVGNPDLMADAMYFRDLGMEIVDPDAGENFWKELSWEQAGQYPADLILLDARTGNPTPEDLAAIPTWSSLPAVEAGQVAPWYPEPTRSWRGFAPILRDIATAIREAAAGIA